MVYILTKIYLHQYPSLLMGFLRSWGPWNTRKQTYPPDWAEGLSKYQFSQWHFFPPLPAPNHTTTCSRACLSPSLSHQTSWFDAVVKQVGPYRISLSPFFPLIATHVYPDFGYMSPDQQQQKWLILSWVFLANWERKKDKVKGGGIAAVFPSQQPFGTLLFTHPALTNV